MDRRILVVGDAFYPKLGGGERVIAESSGALRRRGHEIWILAGTDDPDLPLRQEWDGLHIVRYRFSPRNTLSLNLSGILGAARAVRQVLRRAGPFDLIHSHNVFAASGIRLCREARALPAVSTFHGPVHREFERSQAERALTGGVIRRALQPGFVPLYAKWLRTLQARVVRAGLCVVLSRYAGRVAQDVAPGYPSDRLRLVPGGVDLERFSPTLDRAAARSALGLPPEGPLLLTVRRLVPRMGVEALIDALGEVRSRYPTAHLIVGGSGPLEGALRGRASALGLSGSMSLPGLIPEDLLPRYYQSADLFVLPSLDLESFGLVTLESLACGTPVLATRVGGSVEILDALDDAFLADEAVPVCLAKAILRFLDDKWEGPPLRDRCRSFVADRYSWDLTAARLEAVYDEIA